MTSRRDITIRPASVENDLEWVVDGLAQFAGAYGTARSLYPGRDRALEIIGGLMTAGAFFVAEDVNRDRVGLIGGMIAPHPYNPDIRVLMEMFWYVVPERRARVRAAAALLDTFTQHGRLHADWITFGNVVGRTDASDSTMRRRGFKAHEMTYLLEVDRSTVEA